ncbi:MAG: hypothetical protein AAF492_24500, partial [Verrucomicrobiota bacterium]
EAGGTPSGTESWYSFDYGNIHFICLDSSYSDLSAGGAMMTWLEADLENTTQEWLIAYFHHQPYSKGSHDSDDPFDSAGRLFDMRTNALPILESYGVDLVFAGHSQGYERSVYLHGHYGVSSTYDASIHAVSEETGRVGETGPYEDYGTGTVYAVFGNSSIPGFLQPVPHPVMVESIDEVLGSVVLDVSNKTLRFTYLQSTGATSDWFTLVHPPVTLPAVHNLKPLSEVSSRSARAEGVLSETGAAPASVTLFYGLADGGKTATDWDASIDLGPQPRGAVSATLSTLLEETRYYFRFRASNVFGTNWASLSGSFRTSRERPDITALDQFTAPAMNSGFIYAHVNATGIPPTDVVVFYGLTDGGTNPLAWDSRQTRSNVNEGNIGFQLTGLISNTNYYYRFMATNGFGFDWTEPSSLLCTLPPAGVDLDADGMVDSWEVLFFCDLTTANRF